jgi:FtsP/CotA-like multicopper oxidase with cupredoxin domain
MLQHAKRLWPAALLLALLAPPVGAQGIRIQCPSTTEKHPNGNFIKCDHLLAGDGMVHMADGYEQYVFSFARLPLNITDPGEVMMQGMLAANFPAPTIEVDQGDELFLNLTNVGMMVRPDLFDPHTVHWHGFPQAASVFDGVPDASISINMGATLTYYYNVMDPGTYMYHCHVEATEHMQMGMLGNLYVRAAQNRLEGGTMLGSHEHYNDGDADNEPYGDWPGPGDVDNGPVGIFNEGTHDFYAYNDGDGSTYYDVDYPIQIGSFDPDFHDASFNVQPLPFAGMRDRYFMLNGRGYPDTVNTAELETPNPLTNVPHASQKLNSLIEANVGDRILLRISNLNVTQFNTLGTIGIPMTVVGIDARQLRDDAGGNQYYTTNSVTLGGGQSYDVILDTTGVAAGTYFLYSTNLNQLANDTDNFGGAMTEIILSN